MAVLPQWMRLPHPRTFLWIMSLRTGTEMIALSMLFNKVTGFYGLLAILTGLKLNAAQLSMYLYSVVALILIGLLMPHIRRQSPMQCLALAWLYMLDTVINSVYTVAFAVTWFLTVSASETTGSVPEGAPGMGTMNDTAGFTNPIYNVSEVTVVVTPDTGALGSAAAAAIVGDPNLQHGVQVAESVPSILIIVCFMLIRVYFILVIMSYTREVLCQHIKSSNLNMHMDGASDDLVTNPFAADLPEGKGWKGKLGRIMVSIGKGYWLGGVVDEEWTKDINNRFRTPKQVMKVAPRDTFERERRARSGTGPPRPSSEVFNGALLPQ